VETADSTWRIYDDDGLIAEVARTTTKPLTRFKAHEPEPSRAPFMIALRGYDMRQVDALLAQADQALASDTEVLRRSARDVLRTATFRQRVRGYDRREVDDAVAQRLRALE
jgi:DivIVA domain-containing protein